MAPLLFLAVLTVRGRFGSLAALVARAFARRWPLAAGGIFLVLFSQGLNLWANYAHFLRATANSPLQPHYNFLDNFLLGALWPASLVVFLAWLSPSFAKHHLETPAEKPCK